MQSALDARGASSSIIAGTSEAVMPVYPRSKSILDHLQECKRENNERLKQVRNLEDLVKFKLTTVADKIKGGDDSMPVDIDLY